MVIDFNGTLKKFSYTASMNSGYLSAEDPNVEARLQAYQDYGKTGQSWTAWRAGTEEPEGGIGEAVIGNRPHLRRGRMPASPRYLRFALDKKSPASEPF